MKRGVFRGGFALIELLVIVAVVLIAGVVLLLPSIGRTGCGNRQLRDWTQVRGLHQGMVTWAQSHHDRFPLPSVLDPGNLTVKEMGTEKDHTANILSPLIFNGTISTELLINPAEASGKIRLKDDYEFENPKAAVNPAKALWDPSLRVDFTSEQGGNNSYAHLLPSGARLKLWTNTNSLGPAQAVLGNRGPEIASVKQNRDGTVAPKLVNPDTITFLIHGSRKAWEGNVAFQDNHVEFLSSLKRGSYVDSKGVKREDVLFFDEPDDPTGLNALLGIFTKAGGTPREFTAIWD